MKTRIQGSIYIAVALSLPLLFAALGSAVSHLVASPTEAAKASEALFTIAMGLGAVGWAGGGGMIMAFFLRSTRIGRGLFWGIYMLSLLLAVSALPMVISLGRVQLFAPYLVCFSIGFLIGASKEQEREKLEKRTAWMK